MKREILLSSYLSEMCHRVCFKNVCSFTSTFDVVHFPYFSKVFSKLLNFFTRKKKNFFVSFSFKCQLVSDVQLGVATFNFTFDFTFSTESKGNFFNHQEKPRQNFTLAWAWARTRSRPKPKPARCPASWGHCKIGSTTFEARPLLVSERPT